MIFFNANTPVRAEDAGGHGVGGSVKAAIGSYSLSGTLLAGQVIPMLAVPSGARIVDVVLSSQALDSGNSLKISIGDKTNPARYFDASSLAQAGGTERLNLVDGIAYRYAKSDTVNVVVDVAPTIQSATGEFKLLVLYVID